MHAKQLATFERRARLSSMPSRRARRATAGHLGKEAPDKAPRQLGQQQDAAQDRHAGPHVCGRHLRTLLAMLRAMVAMLCSVRTTSVTARGSGCGGSGCLAVGGWGRKAAVQAVSPVLEHASHVVPLSQKVGHRQLQGHDTSQQGNLGNLDCKLATARLLVCS